MKVLLTGATGFIGPHVVAALLQAGHAVHALVRPGSEDRLPAGVLPTPGDLTVPESLARAVVGVDAVVHMGALLRSSRPALMERVNVQGTLALARAARAEAVGRFVFVSSLAAQGPSAAGDPHRAAGREAPIEAYGRSKLAAEAGLRAGEGPRWTTVLRPGVVLGEGDQLLRPLARLVRGRIAPDLPGQRFSFIDVRDLAALITRVLAADAPGFGPYFVTHPEPVESARLLDTIERLVGEAPAVRVPVPRGVLRLLAPAAEALVRGTGLGRDLLWLRDLSHASWTAEPAEAEAAFDWRATHGLESAVRSALRP